MFATLSNGWLTEQPVQLQAMWELRAVYAVFGIGYAAIWLIFVAFAILRRHYRMRFL